MTYANKQKCTGDKEINNTLINYLKNYIKKYVPNYCDQAEL